MSGSSIGDLLFDESRWLCRELDSGCDELIVSTLSVSNRNVREQLCRATRLLCKLTLDCSFYRELMSYASDVVKNVRVEELTLVGVRHWTRELTSALQQQLQRSNSDLRRLELTRCAPLTERLKHLLLTCSCGLKSVKFCGSSSQQRAHFPETTKFNVEIALDEGSLPSFSTSRSSIVSIKAADATTFVEGLLLSPSCRLERIESSHFFDFDVLAKFIAQYKQLRELSIGIHFDGAGNVFRSAIGTQLTKLKVVRRIDREHVVADEVSGLCELLMSASSNIGHLDCNFMCSRLASSLVETRGALVQHLALHGCRAASVDLRRLFQRLPLVSVSLENVRLHALEDWPIVLEALPSRVESFSLRMWVCFADQTTKMHVVHLIRRPLLKHLKWCVHEPFDEYEQKRIANALRTSTPTLRSFVSSFREEQQMISEKTMLASSALIRWTYCNNDHATLFVNHRNKCCVARARIAVRTLIGIRKFRRSCLDVLPRDVLVQCVARHLWDTRSDASAWWDGWDVRIDDAMNDKDVTGEESIWAKKLRGFVR